MITIEQIRAARALLNWTQKKLAESTGISVRALNSIESGDSTPRLNTIDIIQETFERAGIEFLGDNGIRQRREKLAIEKFEGALAIESLINDIFKTLKISKTKELMVFNLDERKFSKVAVKTLNQHNLNFEHEKLKERLLIKYGDNFILSKPSHYRWFSSKSHTVPHLIYGDTVAFILWDSPIRIICLRNQDIAESYANVFEEIWKISVIPSFAQKALRKKSLDKLAMNLSTNEIRELGVVVK